jgi:hypothetical protein
MLGFLLLQASGWCWLVLACTSAAGRSSSVNAAFQYLTLRLMPLLLQASGWCWPVQACTTNS